MADNEHTTYTVKIVRDEDGALYGHVLQLPGCFASGDDLAELSEALSEAISLYLSTEDVSVSVKLGDTARVLRVIDGDDEGDTEVPAELYFALAK